MLNESVIMFHLLLCIVENLYYVNTTTGSKKIKLHGLFFAGQK